MEVRVLPEVVLRYGLADFRRTDTPINILNMHVRFDVQVIDREINGFRRWVANALSFTQFSIVECRSYKDVCYITRSPHAQTKYGFHLGIRYVNVCIHVSVPSYTGLHGVLSRLRAYHGVKTIKATFTYCGSRARVF